MVTRRIDRSSKAKGNVGAERRAGTSIFLTPRANSSSASGLTTTGGAW